MHKYFGFFMAVLVGAVAYYTFGALFRGKTLSDVAKVFSINWPAYSTSSLPRPRSYTLPPSRVTPPPSYPSYTTVPPPGVSASDLSPYYRKVTLSSVNPSGGVWTSQLTLYANVYDGSVVDITGWQVQGSRGGITIPRAIRDANPSGFYTDENILLKQGDYVLFYGSASPIGQNLRLNSCAGFLNLRASFSPPLPTSCPTFSHNNVAGLTENCQSYVLNLPMCTEPSANSINSFAASGDSSCQDFLSHINYSGCYSRYRNTADFFSHEVRVWMGSLLPLDIHHDTLSLLDRNGLLVDRFTY